jgi:hypothetical protein
MSTSSGVQGRFGDWARSAARAAIPGVLASILACGVAGAIVFTGPSAEAETTYESAYGFDRTWNAALRMVRVDMGCKVTEKDDQSGYLMFEYHSAESGRKTSDGSIEFIRSKDPDAPVRLVIQLPQMPRYHEQVMLDTLVRKMRSEYGDPPQPKPKPAPPPPPSKEPARDGGAPPDAGTDPT